MKCWIVMLCFATALNSFGQQTRTSPLSDMKSNTFNQTIENIPSKSFDYIDKKYTKLGDDIQKRSERLLKRMQDKEAKLQRKLRDIDSTKAKELFETSKAKYQELQNKVQGSVDKTTAKLKEYIPGLDSITSSLKFLSQPSLSSNVNADQLNRLMGTGTATYNLSLEEANKLGINVNAAVSGGGASGTVGVSGEIQTHNNSGSTNSSTASTSVTATGYIYSATIIHNYSLTYVNRGLVSSTSTTSFQITSNTQFSVTKKL